MKDSVLKSDSSGLLIGRLNRIPVVTRSHRMWTVLLGGAFLFELADIQIFGLVAPTLRQQWGLSVADIGLVTSFAFLGMFVGAIVGGRLSDIYGRRPVLIIATLTFSGFSMLSAAAPNFAVLGTLRFLTGVGLTAMTVVGLTYISEMYPVKLRGRYLTLIFGIGLAGVPIISWFARLVIPLGDDGWRWVFVLGGIGIFFGIAMIKSLPESIRWQAAHGRSDQAEALMCELEWNSEDKLGVPLPTPVEESGQIGQSGRMRELFMQHYRKRTIVIIVVAALIMLGFYGFNGWLPTLLVERGFTSSEALTFSSLLAIGAIPGAMIFWPIIDRWERKYIAAVSLLVIAVLALIFGFTTSVPLMLIAGFMMATLLQATASVMYVYTPEIYPTSLRAIGGGFANGSGRVAAFIGSNIIPVVFTSFGFSGVFIYIAVTLTAGGILIVLLGEKTTGRTLEEISGENQHNGPGGSVIPGVSEIRA